MTFLVFVCLAAFLWLLHLLRADKVSLGLPIAYLYSLLLIHVPGAFAHIVGRDFLFNSDVVEIGMGFVSLGSVCFVAGVCSGGGLASTASAPSMKSPVSALRLIKGEGFGCWA